MAESFGPFLEVARIQSEINRLFDNLLDLGDTAGERGAWVPNADVVERPDALLVRVELPGVEPEDLIVHVNGGDLVVAGEKKPPPRPEGGRSKQEERAFGQFRRVIRLEVPVNTRHAEACLADGLLAIRFPRVPNRRGEDVPIEVKSR